MSKLNVNEIEATSTNTNVKVVPKGANATCEIKGTDDATLQLNCSAQSHGVKLKAPNSTAAQNYTMILPDNQIAAGKMFKVKSITGTGASAVGQLEFADQPSQDITSLNASSLTSGTISPARMPTVPASTGTSLELVNIYTTGAAVSNVIISISDQNSVYKLIGRNIQFSSASTFEMVFQDSSGNRINSGIEHTRTYHNSTSTSSGAVYLSNSTYQVIPLGLYSSTAYSFIADFCPKAGQQFMMLDGFSPGGSSPQNNRFQQWVTMYSSSQGINRIKFEPSTASATIQANSQFLLYKYRES